MASEWVFGVRLVLPQPGASEGLRRDLGAPQRNTGVAFGFGNLNHFFLLFSVLPRKPLGNTVSVGRGPYTTCG